MKIKRADSRDLDPKALATMLKKFGIDEDSLYASGTESNVYLLDDERILKVYSDPKYLTEMGTLKDFYDNLVTKNIEFDIPKIISIHEDRNVLGVVEKRLPGKSLSELMVSLDVEGIRAAARTYFSTVVELDQLKLNKVPDRFRLFDENGETSTAFRDWNGFVVELVKSKTHLLRSALNESVQDFHTKEKLLLNWFATPYQGKIGVIHGDFFPGNVLVESPSKVTGVIDFGLFTMYGDRMFDLSTAWLFHTMYSEDDTRARENLLPLVMNFIPSDRVRDFYRYALVYSLIACDLWLGQEALQESGHFRWSMEILNNESYWKRAA